MSQLLHITTNQKCNLNCIYCCEWVRINGDLLDRKLKGGLDDTIRNEKIFNDIKLWATQFDWLVFSSWEPTLNPKLSSFISAAKSEQYSRIELVTNWILISDLSYLEKLKYSGLNSLVISVNSFHPKISKIVSWNNYDGKKTLQWIQNALKLDIELIVNIVITRYTLTTLIHTLQVLYDVGVKNITLSYVRYDGFDIKAYAGYEKIEKNFISYSDCIEVFVSNRFIGLYKKFSVFKFNDFPICVLVSAKISVVNYTWSKNFTFFDKKNGGIKNLEHVWIKRTFLKKCSKCRFKPYCCWLERDYTKIREKEELETEITIPVNY